MFSRVVIQYDAQWPAYSGEQAGSDHDGPRFTILQPVRRSGYEEEPSGHAVANDPMPIELKKCRSA